VCSTRFRPYIDDNANDVILSPVRSAAADAPSAPGALTRAGYSHLQSSLPGDGSSTADDGWAAAVAGCEEVHHVASPIPYVQPEDPDELIVPAREGVLRVLRAARDGAPGVSC
jgi:dihydroflavonol-4-reductase